MIALLYYFLPVFLANLVPPLLTRWLPSWNTPLDGGIVWKGERLLGVNKTWRGFIGGVVVAEIVFLVQLVFFTPSTIPYNVFPWWYGFLLGFGTLFVGDALESCIKRRIRIAPGKPWVPFDQLDFAVGALLVTFGFYWPGIGGASFLLAASLVLSLLTKWVGKLAKVNENAI